ncbi:ABC-2 family transporter protein [Rosistilla oblonga]|uniref:ABC-2 family transporter protein n=1 Tax=Rosistilla oblonga TaxID=2527990 RepID=A0A518J0D2_9BACT|nr:ABC transporter permease [Rosistilla oblonga]QDV13043.1 ABC-2 family transporter protein [Rosistilla oblonga]QDV58788.1 ABC-2 family transporter protein [Rosistilla oblonga]
MTLQPEDFWSFTEWLLRPGAFLESALLQGIALIVLAIVVGLLVGYMIAAARYGPSEGFYSVARIVREFVREDAPGTSPRRIYALARLAFKEAIRRKVLFVVGLFIVLLMFAGWYLDPKSDDPARLYISFVLTSTNYLLLMLALFISTASLPNDIKNKTIYTIVTKPVRTTEIILGRVLGFVGVGTMMIVPMGIASYFFVTGDLDHVHEIETTSVLSDDTVVGQTTEDRGHRHSFTLDSDGFGATDTQRGHQHAVIREGDTIRVGSAQGMLRARVPVYGEMEFFDRSGRPDEKGINVGYEDRKGGFGSAGLSRLVNAGATGARRIQHGYVEGASLSRAEYTFSDVTPEKYPDGVPIEFTLRAFRSLKGDIITGVQGTLTVQHPTKPIESNPFRFEVKEYQVDDQFIPLEMEGTNITETGTLSLYDDLVDENGHVKIVVRCIDPGQYLGMTQSDLYLKPAENSFAWNLTKGFISIWLQMVLIISFGVMFSTFLNGSVAMLATFICVVLGFSAESIYEARYYQVVGQTMGGGPIESVVRLLRQDAFTTELDVESAPKMIIQGVDSVIMYCLDLIATALPNLPKMMQTAEFVASGFDVLGGLLARHVATTLCYLIMTCIIAYFFLKTREIAA